MPEYLKGRRGSKLFDLSPRQVQRRIRKYAEEIGIQRITTESGTRSYKLLTPKTLREAGERYSKSRLDSK